MTGNSETIFPFYCLPFARSAPLVWRTRGVVSVSPTIGVIKDCGVSRERHSFDKNDCSRRVNLLEGR